MSDVDDALVRRHDLDLSPPRGVYITRIDPQTLPTGAACRWETWCSPSTGSR